MTEANFLIATPAHGGMVTLQYMRSIRGLESEFGRQSPPIQSDVVFATASFLPFSRNALASIVLNNPRLTHLLFVDSDMGFAPSAVMKLLYSGHDFCGCFCPNRSIDYGRFAALARQIDDLRTLQNVAIGYAGTDRIVRQRVRSEGGETIRHMVQDGFVRTLKMGMGITLIRRTVLDRIAEACPDLIVDAGRAGHYAAMGMRGRILECFSSMHADGMSLSEDVSFCRRWTDLCGGEIYGLVDETIQHVGQHAFSGRMIDRIEHEDASGGA